MMPRSMLLAVSLVTAAMLSLETLLPRLYAVYVGPNFVFFSISLALIGLSAGGVMAVLMERRLLANARARIAGCASLFAASFFGAVVVTAAAGSLLNATVDRRYEAILRGASSATTDALTRSILIPSGVFVIGTGVVMALPFVFAGLFLALVFRAYPARVGRLYAADLFGAAAGCVLTVVTLQLMSLGNALVFASLLAAVAGAVTDPRQSFRRPIVFVPVLGLLSVVAIGLVWNAPLNFRIHRYAHLRSFHETAATEHEARWTPLGRIALLSREWSPSLNATVRMRPKWMVAMDLGGHSIVETFSRANLQNIKHTSVFSDDVLEPVIVPGFYRDRRDYLVLMAGNGQDLLRLHSWYGDGVGLQGVELNPAIYDMGLNVPSANLREFFAKPAVTMHIADGRTFTERVRETFDVINLSYSGATFAVGSGALSTTPQFLFTREAFVTYLRKLRPGGAIVDSVNTDVGADARSLRTFAAALEEVNPHADVRQHVLCFTWPERRDEYYYAIFHRDPLQPQEVEAARVGLARQGLELVFPKGSGSSLFDVGPLLAGRPASPARFAGFPRLAEQRVHTDDQPFYYFDLWPGRIGGFLFLGYLLTFAGAAGIAGLYLMVPLLLSRWRGRSGETARPMRGYPAAFSLLGAGFMFVEVGMIQRFELFLGSPAVALVVIVGLLLLAAGLGSWLTSTASRERLPGVRWVALISVLYILALLAFLNYLIYPLMGLPTAAKVAIIGGVLAPFGAAVGTMFPTLLAQLSARTPRFVPWALALNGIFSVAASNLGGLVYILFGANAVILVGASCYALLAAMAPRPTTKGA